MLKNGAFAVAVVHRQVVVVQGMCRAQSALHTTNSPALLAVRTHSKREKYLEVTPYAAFGGSRIFLALSEKHIARIPVSDVLSVLPSSAPSDNNSDASDSDSDCGDVEEDVQRLTNSKSHCYVFGSDVVVGEGTIELPEHAFQEFVRLSEAHYNRPRSASRSTKLWSSLTGRAASRH